MQKFELKHYNYIGIADTTFSIYKRNFKLFFIITAIFFLIPIFIQKTVEMRLDMSEGCIGIMNNLSGSMDNTGWQENTTSTETGCIFSVIVVLVHFFLNTLYAVPVIIATTNILLNREMSLASAFTARFGTYFRMLLATLGYMGTLSVLFVIMAGILAAGVGSMMMGCAQVIGCGAAFIPAGIVTYLAVLWSLYMPAIVLEGWAGRNALGRSAALIRGTWWWSWRVIAGILIIQALVSFGSQMAFGTLHEFLMGWNPHFEIVSETITAAGLTLVEIFVRPLLFIGLTLLFFDAKVRKEAYDLEIMIEEF